MVVLEVAATVALRLAVVEEVVEVVADDASTWIASSSRSWTMTVCHFEQASIFGVHTANDVAKLLFTRPFGRGRALFPGGG